MAASHARTLLVLVATCVGCAAESPREEATSTSELSAPEPELHARVKRQIASVVGGAYADYDWDALLAADEPWNGVKVWVPGTGEATRDVAGQGRAMGAVPEGLASGGPAIAWPENGAPPRDAWVGISCSQSKGGALWAERGILSALDVFATAWPDALAIASRLGPRLRGAWLVGHSAGALPVLLAGLIGGAHRVDVYGIPSAVGALDGDDGLAHLHTDPLDPAGAMGWIRPDGAAQLNLGGAFVTALEGGGLQHHDYARWPAPSP